MKKNVNGLSIKYSSVIVILYLSPFLAPAYIGLAYPVINAIINACQIVSLIMLVITGYKRPKKTIFYISAFYLPVIISTVINQNDIKTAVFQYAYAIGISWGIECMINRYGVKETSEPILFIFELLTYSNLLSIILFPNGLYHTSYRGVQLGELLSDSGVNRVGWLLGHQSLCSVYSISAISVALLYSIYHDRERSQLRSSLLIIAALAQSILSKSGMNRVVVILVIISFFIIKFGFKNIIRHYKWILSLFILGTILILSGALEPLDPLIRQVFNRSADMTGRISIWWYALNLFTRSPIYGYGLEFETGSNLSSINNVSHAHNQYIQALYSGGCIGFIGLVFCMVKFLKVNKITICDNKSKMIVVLSYFVLMIMLTDVYFFRHPVVFIPLLINLFRAEK